MFKKLVFLVACLGLVAACLLAIRQQRVRAAHEVGRVQRSVGEHDRTLWQLRLEIAHRTTPDKVEAMAGTLGELAPISSGRYRALVQAEHEHARTSAVASTAD